MERINRKIGILGGGQLGKMLFSAGLPLGLDLSIMDKNRSFPAGRFCAKFSEGDFTAFEDVAAFGRRMDVVTIEIEKINVDALKHLQSLGIDVFPQPGVVEIIQDKARQKAFFERHAVPTSPFKEFKSSEELARAIRGGSVRFPFIQKIRKDGYDGRGVATIEHSEDLKRGFQHDFLIEDKVSIEKEISVIVCRSNTGETVAYDAVEMVFDPNHHILRYQLGPADLSVSLAAEAKRIALRLSEAFGIVGLLAIEMFLTKDGEILVNEVAPRPHNSGHHTIEACLCSQYENHLRAIAGWPLGSTDTRSPSVLLNLLGEPGYTGPVKYEGLDSVLGEKGVYVHLYGKADTRPNRKMGHVTILGETTEHLMEKYNLVQATLKVKA